MWRLRSARLEAGAGGLGSAGDAARDREGGERDSPAKEAQTCGALVALCVADLAMVLEVRFGGEAQVATLPLASLLASFLVHRLQVATQVAPSVRHVVTQATEVHLLDHLSSVADASVDGAVGVRGLLRT